MWLWIVGAVLTIGGVMLARMAFADEAFLAPALGWGFVGLGAAGAVILVYKASTAGIVS